MDEQEKNKGTENPDDILEQLNSGKNPASSLLQELSNKLLQIFTGSHIHYFGRKIPTLKLTFLALMSTSMVVVILTKSVVMGGMTALLKIMIEFIVLSLLICIIENIAVDGMATLLAIVVLLIAEFLFTRLWR